jgi:hypothetical protein
MFTTNLFAKKNKLEKKHNTCVPKKKDNIYL